MTRFLGSASVRSTLTMLGGCAMFLVTQDVVPVFVGSIATLSGDPTAPLSGYRSFVVLLSKTSAAPHSCCWE